jgi:hypothetical protein
MVDAYVSRNGSGIAESRALVVPAYAGRVVSDKASCLFIAGLVTVEREVGWKKLSVQRVCLPCTDT